MVHNTPARKEAKGLKPKAIDLSREIEALEGIEDAAQLAGEMQAEAARLREEARELEELARRGSCHGVGGLHCQADQEGREEIRAVDGRLAGRRQGPQGLPWKLQEDEPGRGTADGPEDEKGGFGALSCYLGGSSM